MQVNVRLESEELEHLDELVNYYNNNYKYIKANRSNVIRTAIDNLWQEELLPFKKQEIPYKYRAEKDMPFT